MIIRSLIVIVCIPFLSLGQLDTLDLHNRMDSLKQLDYLNYSHENYLEFQNILSESKRIQFHRGVLESHKQIMWYYSKHRNIDSLFFHSRQFEKHVKLHPDRNLEMKYYGSYARILAFYYYLPEYAIMYFLKCYEMVEDENNKLRLQMMLIECYNKKSNLINQFKRLIS